MLPCSEGHAEPRGPAYSNFGTSGGQGQVETVPVTVARECGVIPEASHEALQAFSFSEMKLYKHAIAYKWTAEELIATIKLIKSTDFKVEDVNVDLHKRVAAAIAQGHFTSHNMRESDLDGDQDLTFWLRSLKNADGYSIRTEHRAIAAKLRYVILYIGIYHVSKWYMT